MLATILQTVTRSALIWFIPIRGKRILFITSVYAYLAGVDETSSDQLVRLNNTLRLVKDIDALGLPANRKCRTLAWGDTGLARALELAKCSLDLTPETFRAMDHATLNELCESILTVAPEWLLYARRDQMKQELFTAITAM